MQIRRLTPADAADYRAMMLRAYAEAPLGFIATVEERGPLPLEWWTTRLSGEPDAAVRSFGAFVDDRLVGSAGIKFERRERTRHKAWLFGMVVAPELRGRNIGKGLVDRVLDEARSTPGVELVQLTVTESNTPARRLYDSCGFRPFGTEPYAIRYGERFESLIHMWCPVGTLAAGTLE